MIIAHKEPSTGTAQKRQSPAAVFGHALLPKKEKNNGGQQKWQPRAEGQMSALNSLCE